MSRLAAGSSSEQITPWRGAREMAGRDGIAPVLTRASRNGRLRLALAEKARRIAPVGTFGRTRVINRFTIALWGGMARRTCDAMRTDPSNWQGYANPTSHTLRFRRSHGLCRSCTLPVHRHADWRRRSRGDPFRIHRQKPLGPGTANATHLLLTQEGHHLGTSRRTRGASQRDGGHHGRRRIRTGVIAAKYRDVWA